MSTPSFILGVFESFIYFGASFYDTKFGKRLRKRCCKVRSLSTSRKKIRDGSCNKTQIETHRKERSEAQFTHGICPGYTKGLYLELDEEQ
jgi:hypothetical protein